MTENGTLTRESISLGVSYDTNVNLLKDEVIKLTNEHSKILKHPEPILLFDNYGDSALKFELFSR